MPISPASFRLQCRQLVHFAPSGFLRLDLGLLTASHVLDLNADPASGRVRARFRNEACFSLHDKERWKSHSRFLRGAGEVGCNLIVQDARDPSQSFCLGNNYPLGSGQCLGTTIPLTENRPGDPRPTREDWFRVLNGMFWVFDSASTNPGVIRRIRDASPTASLSKLTIETAALSDTFLD